MDKNTMDKAYKYIEELYKSGLPDDVIAAAVKKHYGIEDVYSFAENYKNSLNQGDNDTPEVDNESPINDVENNSNIPDWDAIAKRDAKEAGEKYQEDKDDGEGRSRGSQVVAGAVRDSDAIGKLIKIIGSWAKNLPTEAQNYLFKNFADNAVQIFGKDKELVNELVGARKGMTGREGLSEGARKKILGKFIGTLAQGIYTDAKMMRDVGKANKQGLNKANRWSGVFDAVDSATETLPWLSWIDLAGDTIGYSVGKDDNGENYSRGGLLTKISNMVEQGVYDATNGKHGDNTARTFWENNPEEQEKDVEAREWMQDRGYKGGTWGVTNFVGNSSLTGMRTKKGSKAERDKEDDKAIDKIQGNTKGKGVAVKNNNDTNYVDKEQKDKGDANKYIMYHNRANGKGIDSKGAYTFNDFTKDFYQDDNGTWINKKTKQTASEMWRKEKDKADKKEGGKGYNPEGETINI